LNRPVTPRTQSLLPAPPSLGSTRAEGRRDLGPAAPAGQVGEGNTRGRTAKRRVTKTPSNETTLADQGDDKNLAKASREAAAQGEEGSVKEVTKKVRIVVAAAENNKAVITAARAERHAAKKEKRAEVESKLAEKIIAMRRRGC
jgi:hypothetical protein